MKIENNLEHKYGVLFKGRPTTSESAGETEDVSKQYYS